MLLDNNMSHSIPARVLLWLISIMFVVEVSHNNTLAGMELDRLLSKRTNRLPFAVIEAKNLAIRGKH